MRIRLLSLMCLCTVGMARATPNKLPYTEKQFEMAVACIKHFEGWHTTKNYPYVGYGHQLQRGERYSARTLTQKQGDLLLRLDLMRNLYLFRGYGKDALLLSVLAYNVGPYAIIGTSKRPKSRLLRKIERGEGTSIMIISPSAAGMADKCLPSSSAGRWNTTCSLFANT